MAIKTTSTQASKKDTQAPAKKAPAKSAAKTASKPAAKPQTKTVTSKNTAPKVEAKAPTKTPTKTPAKAPRVDTSRPVVAQKAAATSGKTAYHVSKRDNDGREWKVFIQGSNKVIKLFNTQAEALDYAKSLCKNKDDGSYVLLHGLDGKIRKF